MRRKTVESLLGILVFVCFAGSVDHKCDIPWASSWFPFAVLYSPFLWLLLVLRGCTAFRGKVVMNIGRQVLQTNVSFVYFLCMWSISCAVSRHITCGSDEALRATCPDCIAFAAHTRHHKYVWLCLKIPLCHRLFPGLGSNHAHSGLSCSVIACGLRPDALVRF